MVLKTLETLLDIKEIKPVNSKKLNPEYSLEGLMLKLDADGAFLAERQPLAWDRCLLL